MPSCLLVAAVWPSGCWEHGKQTDCCFQTASVLGANDPVKDNPRFTGTNQIIRPKSGSQAGSSHFRRNSWIEIRVWRDLNVKASRPGEAIESQNSKNGISVSIEHGSGASCSHQSLLSRIHHITHTHTLYVLVSNSKA